MKQITIYDLLPLLRKGWVAMDKDGSWGWYRTRPYQVGGSFWVNNGDRDSSMFFCFRIKRFKGGWRDSLIKVERSKKKSTDRKDFDDIVEGELNALL